MLENRAQLGVRLAVGCLLVAFGLGPLDARADDDEDAATRAPRARRRLNVSGHVVFSRNVYEAVVGLSPYTPINERVARRAETEILRFLRASGYQLARVAARPGEDIIEVVVDEGRLRRVVFPGQDAMRAIGMTLALDLQQNVFNRPDFEAKLPELEREFGVTITGYELKPTEAQSGRDFGIPGLPGFKTLSEWLNVPTQGGWELFIFSTSEELPAGWELNADFVGPDGLTSSLLYRWRSALMRDDRLEVSPEIGLRVQDVVTDGEGRRAWSRVGGGVRWLSPPIGPARVRPFVWPRALVISRQRRDLNLELYDFVQFEPVVGSRVPVGDVLELRLGVGVQYRNLLLIRREAGAPVVPKLTPADEWRTLFSVGAEFDFGQETLRLDRPHRLGLEGRAYTLVGRQQLYYVSADYDKVWSAFAYDDIVLGVAGESVAGDVTFTDEVRLSDHLRGLYGDEFFTDQIASLSLEYRYALVENVLKIAAFHDGAVFRGFDRETGREFPRFANAFGLGLTAVVFEFFEASVYGAVGLMSENGPTDIGLAVSLEQLF